MNFKTAFYIPDIPDGNTTPCLGPLYLAALLEQHDFETKVFDARLDPGALSLLLDYHPDLVGISAVTAGFNAALRAAAAVKQNNPLCTVALGGPHPTALPEQVIAHDTIDYVFIGESEKTFPALCLLLRNGIPDAQSLQSIPNLLFKQNNQIFHTEPADFLTGEELDQLPLPAFHAMDMDRYFAGTQQHGLFHRGKRILPVMTARGCPGACTYCCRTMGQKIRARSLDSVKREIDHLVQTWQIDELYIEDDNFTVQRPRALDLLRWLADYPVPLHLKFANGIRADRIDRELLLAMKAARVYALSFGIESGSLSTLTRMKKRLSLETARENVLLAKSLGFLVGANCIIGYPGESELDIRDSLDFFLNLPLDSMAIVNLVPFPGTEVRKFCEQHNYLTEEAADWDNYYFSINRPIPLIETPQLSKPQLIRAVRNAYRRMYLRPRWLLRAAKHLTPAQMLRGAAVLLGKS